MVALMLATLLAAPAGDNFKELTVDQVDQLIASKQADIFDNNGQDEWKEAHVPSAKWVKFNDVKESDLPKDKARELVFYCHNEQ
jgi:rhodanese-related sulfurtransferase